MTNIRPKLKLDDPDFGIICRKFKRKFPDVDINILLDKVEEIESFIDQVSVKNPFNWLGYIDESRWCRRVLQGSTDIISPVQMWEQNHELMASFIPDFEKADLPIQMAIVKSFMFSFGNTIESYSDAVVADYANTFNGRNRRIGAFEDVNYMDKGDDIEKFCYGESFYMRKITKYRIKGSLLLCFLFSYRGLKRKCQNQNVQTDSFYHYNYFSAKDGFLGMEKFYSVDKQVLIDLNTELFDCFLKSKNSYNKKIFDFLDSIEKELLEPTDYLVSMLNLDQSNKIREVLNQKITMSSIKKELDMGVDHIFKNYDKNVYERTKLAEELIRSGYPF